MWWDRAKTWLLSAAGSLAILAALYLAQPVPTRAEGPTYVSGIIYSPTNWTASGSPYIVTGNLLVTRTVTMTVEPGVTVRFDGPYYLRVDGALKAIGTPAQPITFTSNKASPARGDWQSIRFSAGSTSATFDVFGNYLDGSTLQYVTVEYGGGSDIGEIAATIKAEGEAAPFIMGATIRKGAGYGVYTQAGEARIMSNTVEDNQGPFWSGGAIHVEGPAKVLNNVVQNNTGGLGGIGVWVARGPAVIAYNTVVSNSGGSIGAGIIVYAGVATIVSNTVSGNAGTGVSLSGSSATISGNAISSNTAGGIKLWGSSSARISKNLIAGNRAERGAGLYLEGPSVLEGNVIRGNIATGSGGGLFASNPVTATWNEISGNIAASGGGLYISGKAGPVFANSITGNSQTALHNASNQPVSASHNYWGTTDTSAIAAAIYDFYDDFDKGVVSYAPFLTAPISLPWQETFVPLVTRDRASGW